MEVIASISQTRPGEILPRHFHNGEEAFYVLDDTTIELTTVSATLLPHLLKSMFNQSRPDRLAPVAAVHRPDPCEGQ
jgi:hypothetical protein